MKKKLLFLLLSKLNSKDALMKKMKVIIGIGVVSLCLVFGLFIWAGVALTKSLTQQIGTMQTEATVHQALTGTESVLTKITSQRCLNQIQGLGTVQVWVGRPLAETFESLRQECFQQAQPNCQEGKCEKQII